MRNLLLTSINSMGDCLALFNNSFMIVYTNKSAQNVFNFKIGDYCCNRFKKIKDHDDNCHLHHAVTKKEEIKTIEDIPISFVKDWRSYVPKGEDDICELTFESIYTPLFDKDSTLWGCIKLSRNLTDKRCLENKLKKLLIMHSRKSTENQERLEEYIKKANETKQQLAYSEKLASLGKISAGISHEIYNSLSVLGPKIKMFGLYLDKVLNILKEYKQLQNCHGLEEIKERLDKIKNIEKSEKGLAFYTTKLQKFIAPCTSELYRIEKIVEGLNEFTNLQRSEFRYVNINDELENTLILLEYEFTNNNIEIIKRYDPTLTDVPCYPADLNQVIINILANSIESLIEKASGNKDFKPVIKITTKRMGEEVVLTFYDNGIGYPEESEEKIFDPFFTTKSPTVNPGLGLSTVLNIIENKHKGKIEARSQPREFAEFTLKLPLSLKEPALL